MISLGWGSALVGRICRIIASTLRTIFDRSGALPHGTGVLNVAPPVGSPPLATAGIRHNGSRTASKATARRMDFPQLRVRGRRERLSTGSTMVTAQM